MHTLRKTVVCTALAVMLSLVVFTPGNASALNGGDFRPGRIIDDGVFFNGSTLAANDIQNFLNSKVPVCDTNGTQPRGGTTRAAYGASKGYPPPYTCLKDFRQDTPARNAETGLCGSYSGGNKSAAEIIYAVGQSCGISQKALIVLLQKEQSLVTDDWPWPLQYRSATGYGCPDSAPCDSEYYGFFNQVYNAARQFKKYSRDAHLYNHRAGRSSYVQYNPVGSCGGSSIVMENQATAGLYNYTPYQPNQSALNNLYGSGDGCGAYGNRNFWRLYNDWFGSTWNDGFTFAVTDDGSATQYVIYTGVKQMVSDVETKKAWGLDALTPITFPSSYLATITTGPPLDRLMRMNNEPTVYFLDNGKRYRIPWDAMLDTWNLRGKVVSRVSQGLFNVPTDGGDLTYAMKGPDSSTIYLVDGANTQGQTVLRAYQNSDVFRAWEGMNAGYITLSSGYFNAIDNAIGTTLASTKVICGGAEYQIVNGYRLWQTSAVSSIFTGTAHTVSWATIGRLSVGPNVTQVIQSPTSPVYVVDNGVRYPLPSSEALNAWSTPTQDVTIVNNSFLNLIAQGANLNGYLADSGGQLYLINRRKVPIPPSLDTAYRNSGPVLTASSSLMALYPTTTAVTAFIKSNDSSTIYFLDDSGNRRQVSSSTMKAWGGQQATPTELSFYIVNAMGTASSLSTYVSNAGTNYLIDNGKKWTVSPSIAGDWGLSNAQALSDGTVDRVTTAGALQSKARGADGTYYLISGGKAYATVDPSIADVWNIKNAPEMSSQAVPNSMSIQALYRFARSNQQGDNRKFVIESGNWYTADDTQLANVGGNNPAFTPLDPGIAPNTISVWSSVVIKATDNAYFAIDGGGKRVFSDTAILNQWTNSGSLSVPTVSNGFLDLLLFTGSAQKSIKGAGPGIFKIENGTKRFITSPATYNAQYAPYMSVSEALINSLQTGSNL